jgi:hypothetical protein
MTAVAVAAIVIGGCLGIRRNRAQREWLAEYHYFQADSVRKLAEPGTGEIKEARE